MDESGVQEIRIVALEDFIHGGADARPERFREHFFGDAFSENERQHPGLRKLRRTERTGPVPAAIPSQAERFL